MIFESNINIVIAGEAGQGIETASEIIGKILHFNNFIVFSLPEYMSRIRGGCNSSLIKVSSEKSPCYSNKIDVLFALNDKAFDHLKDRITAETTNINLDKNNFYLIGYICALFKLNEEGIISFLYKNFEKYFKKGIEDKNFINFKDGFQDGQTNKEIEIKIPANKPLNEDIIISINDALGLGCISGGCNFVPFYPMSPSTFLQLFLTAHALDFGLVTKQVEDEICVINMAIGAWYAGARALACTSGGGFDLMQEGVSLAGITESPIVINIAQRPGPATGLPTRTEQGDLNLALYSGHGEFPRIIYAPATAEDAFQIGELAFNIADKFQVPVFILTDQALLESTYSIKEFSPKEQNESCIIKSAPDYMRYQLSETCVSPRSIPTYGDGIVCVDSDEHDEKGYLTENSTIRKQMVEKRLNKLKLIKENVLEPYFFGDENFKTLIISWGSNFNVIKESIKNKKGIALLHFIQLYPVSKIINDYINKADRLIIIEQNATGQFESLIKCEFDAVFNNKFLKYNGEPICVEEINDFLEKINEI